MTGEEQVPIIELMRQCFLGGASVQYDIVRERMTGPLGAGIDPDSWTLWWTDHGKALMHGYCGDGDLGDTRPTLHDIHRIVKANQAGIAHMLEAMQSLEPDETLPEGGDLWTLNAVAPGGEELHYTVIAPGLTAAIQAATKAWGCGGWDTLRKRQAHVDD